MLLQPIKSFRTWVLGVVRLGDFIPGQTYSPLDSAVQVHSTESVEAFFAASTGATHVGDAFSNFLKDPEALTALKKSYLAQFEARARIMSLNSDPPEKYGFGPIEVPVATHPLDNVVRKFVEGIAAGVQIVSRPPNAIRSAVRMLLAGLMYTAAFWARISFLLIFRGGASTPLRSTVAAPDIAPMSDFSVIDDALREQGVPARGTFHMVVVCERGLLEACSDGPIPVVDPKKTRVPRIEWLLEALLPGLVLFPRLMMISVRHIADVRIGVLALMAMKQACDTLALRQVAHAVRCRGYLDWVEYNELHILRDILLRRFGGGVIRWPHSSLYAPGVFTSYLGYSTFYSNGPYPADNFSETWSPHTEKHAVGYLQFDRRYQDVNRVAPEYRNVIEDKIAAGKRVIGYFASSTVQGLPEIELQALVALHAALEKSSDWFLVIKPKSHNKQHIFQMLRDDPRTSSWCDDENVLMIHYPDSGEQVCSAGWLAEKMFMGAGLLGSISAEAFSRQRAFYSYYPVFDLTDHSQRLLDLGYLHLDLDSYESAIVSALATPPQNIYDRWYFDNFDPFRDNKALERVASRLVADTKEAPESLTPNIRSQ